MPAAADDNIFERTLAIISDGSFPKPGRRDNLTRGEHRQLRDAMIYEAHVHAGRRVLVSNDSKAYVKDGRRAQLEALGRTNIRTLDEFMAMVADGTLHDLLPPVSRSGRSRPIEGDRLCAQRVVRRRPVRAIGTT